MAGNSPQTALITGASSGIGFEFAKLFAREGYSLVLVARGKKDLEKAAVEIRKNFVADKETRGNETKNKQKIIIIAKDLGKEGAAKAVFNELRVKKVSVDFLINNAGLGLHGKFAETSLERELEMIRVNCEAVVALTKLFLPQMLERKRGRVLNVASTAAFQPGPLMAVYYASKAFVLSFSQALYEELRGTGVNVTAMCPGPTSTAFGRKAGVLNTGLFQGAMMAPEKVARVGYDGMKRGELVVVPGLRNKFSTRLVKMIPQKTLLRMVRRLQEERNKRQ